MVLEISCVVFAMQLSILAPGLALRGPEGSMSFSLSETRKEYGNIINLFYAGEPSRTSPTDGARWTRVV
eukprot:2431877-Pleurochrysis_carterae.AAC.1